MKFAFFKRQNLLFSKNKLFCHASKFFLGSYIVHQYINKESMQLEQQEFEDNRLKLSQSSELSNLQNSNVKQICRIDKIKEKE